MPPPQHAAIYGSLRRDLMARHFALGKFWRANLFTNLNVLGDISRSDFAEPGQTRIRQCLKQPCVPRTQSGPAYRAEQDPVEIDELQRWRVWSHDRTNALKMTGLRSIQLCVEHRLGHPRARSIVKLVLATTASLFKFAADSPFGGYVLRWDPATCDDWELEVDGKGNLKPLAPCRFLINSDLKAYGDQRYLYCTPLDDPRYRRVVEQAIAGGSQQAGQDRFRRWEPSKDEYIGLLCGLKVIFDTFPDDPEIVESVRQQTRRIATYLQGTGYLLARPCGGVTARGCGEILPLLEFPFGDIFERILGERFSSAVSYWDSLRRAGIRPRQLLGSGALAGSQAALQALASVRALLAKHGVEDVGTVMDELTFEQKQQMAELWIDRKTIDAVYAESEGEVFIGLWFNLLSRDRRKAEYHRWLRRAGKGVSDGFKPYLALALLDDDRTRRDYLEWYGATFSSGGAPFVEPTNERDSDWTFATAVAMRAAHARGEAAAHERLAALVEQQLRDLASRLAERSAGAARVLPIMVKGGGSAPNFGGADAAEGSDCGGTAKLASEYHDKAGSWYGYMAMLAQAWQHLADGVPSPFNEIELPSPASVQAWPEPVVPADVVRAAREDRMPVPLDAISRAAPNPSGQSDVPLFDDPPPKPRDDEIGSPPSPRGETRGIDVGGGVLPRTIEERWPYPVLDEPPEEAARWTAVPTFREIERTLVKSHEFHREGNELVVKIELRAVQVTREGRRLRLTYARLQGEYSLAWVRQT
jgi:hypothetical protein